MAQETLYDFIGVKPDATVDDIHEARKKWAKELHPDQTGGDKAAEEKLARINAICDLLENSSKRAAYDLKLKLERLNDLARRISETQQRTQTKTSPGYS